MHKYNLYTIAIEHVGITAINEKERFYVILRSFPIN